VASLDEAGGDAVGGAEFGIERDGFEEGQHLGGVELGVEGVDQRFAAASEVAVGHFGLALLHVAAI